MIKILLVCGGDAVDPRIGLEQDLEGLLEPPGGITKWNGDGVDDPPGRAGCAGVAAHEVDLLLEGQDGRNGIAELGLARRARSVGAGGGPERNDQGRPEFIDCVRMVHLLRDFQAMIDWAGGGQEVGARLLALSGRVFDWWRRFGSGAIRRSTLRSDVGWLRPVVRLNLEAGRDGPCRWTAKVCRQLLAIEGSLWTFARVEGVGPDNNPAERALRHGVIWRKTSGGTDGERGSRFVGRILSVVATCQQRGQGVLSYLTGCFHAHFEGRAAPSLIS